MDKETRKLTGDGEIDEFLEECLTTMATKGDEYTVGSVDRLANFRSVGSEVVIGMEKVWYVFFTKHLRALQSYIKNDCVVKSEEPIKGRIKDLVVYLLLFYKMTQEIERSRVLKTSAVEEDSAAQRFISFAKSPEYRSQPL